MTTSKGSFLKEKYDNLTRWVVEVVGKENLSADSLAGIKGRTELEIVVLANTLQANKSLVSHRDWTGLVQLLVSEGIPAALQEVVVAIRHREMMHDKFWRYMDLFVQVAEQ